jgi:uncharacterized membrane protein YgaE (UPF0421/DUF939 family)
MTTPKPSTDLSEAVRHWVHFDNLAETLHKQVVNARTKRSEYEKKTLTLLDGMKLSNVSMEVHGAILTRTVKTESEQLSWSFLEKTLHSYFASQRQPDQTQAILDFLQKARTVKSVDYLKKTNPKKDAV